MEMMYTTPLKTASVAFSADGVYYGVVSSVVLHRLNITVPRLSGENIYGPLDVVGMNADSYSVGDPVIVGFVEGRQDELVVLGKIRNGEAGTVTSLSTEEINAALALKANLAGTTTFTGTVAGITKTMVGLGSVDNTADTSKPVSTAQQTALDLKANLAGTTTFTGTVIKNSQPCYTGDNTGGGQVTATTDSDFIPVNTILTVGSAFNGSNGRFTVSQACKVLCLFNSLIYRAGNINAHAWVEFRVNNVRKSVRNHLEYNVTGDYAPLSNSAVVSLNANDYVTCRIFTNSGGAIYQDLYGGGLSFYILG